MLCLCLGWCDDCAILQCVSHSLYSAGTPVLWRSYTTRHQGRLTLEQCKTATSAAVPPYSLQLVQALAATGAVASWWLSSDFVTHS